MSVCVLLKQNLLIPGFITQRTLDDIFRVCFLNQSVLRFIFYYLRHFFYQPMPSSLTYISHSLVSKLIVIGLVMVTSMWRTMTSYLTIVSWFYYLLKEPWTICILLYFFKRIHYIRISNVHLQKINLYK